MEMALTPESCGVEKHLQKHLLECCDPPGGETGGFIMAQPLGSEKQAEAPSLEQTAQVGSNLVDLQS